MTADELRSIDLFSTASQEALERLAAAGTERVLEPGEYLHRQGDVTEHLSVLLDGQLESFAIVEGGELRVGVHEPGGFIGAISVLTGDPFPGNTRALTPARVGAIPLEELRDFLHQNLEIERRVLRVFAPVYQRVEALGQQREKMAALGTLSAGLAHELNNPAAAARRSSSELGEAVAAIQSTMRAFVESGVEREDAARFVALQTAAFERAGEQPELGALDAADREDDLLDWLERHGVEEGWRLAPELVAAGIERDWLEQAAAAAGAALGAGIESLVATLTARRLVDELHESTDRISTLVAAMKEYTYMDRAPQQDVDVRKGLDTTLTVLGFKLKPTHIVVRREYEDPLPAVPAWGSELNQVWTNLLDNAIAALGASGTITLRACRAQAGEAVRVEVEDDGPGVPAEVQSRVFEPFFTTKAPGEGTGLGLDTAYRIVVERHRGEMRLDSRPGRTVFTVLLPLSAPPS